jgi:hypothetical protein
MNRSEGIAYLTQCADQQGDHWSGGVTWPVDECPTCHGTNNAGWLRVPCSRYGSTSDECAPVAWRLAYLITRESGEEITTDDLDWAMGLVVNDHDDVAYIVREYGHRMYR